MNRFVERLALLRAALNQNSIDAYIIPLSDPHFTESVPDYWNIISWLTGFTGSAARAVVTETFAGFWTDSRYFLQAERQLAGSGFEVVKPSSSGFSDCIEWIASNLRNGSRIAFDGRIISISLARKLKKDLEGKRMKFQVDCDLVSDIWQDRPSLPSSDVWEHAPEFSGLDRIKKIHAVREQMKKLGIDYHLLTSPDDIMWLLNIRGNDLPFTPLAFSYAILGRKQILLFIDESRFPHTLSSEFDRIDIVMLPYDETSGMISALTDGKTILLDPAATSLTLFNSVPQKFGIIEDISIPARMKAIKNRTEIENIGRVMIKDGAALTKFFYRIENDLGMVPMTEQSLVMRLHEFRAKNEDFIGPSFASIIAFNEHAVLPHYIPSPESDAVLGEKGILLVDSGGQYQGGTTDITRTISLGAPSTKQRNDFTLVLKGFIDLAMAKFPRGTKGCHIDSIARKPLWKSGLNYGHGTGHGVGYCLNVHEGPQSISPVNDKTEIEPGMVISDEPAVYREGEYGIRTENLLLCYEDEETEFGQFLRFDTLSLCFIDKKLIDKSLLDNEEISWLNSYHSEVFEKIGPSLTEEEKAWLKEKTNPV
ncbi:MAG: aminopeptidase P family protein [Bacteroidales bacterium]|jgi:Xaa-Pro aminopeptidase